jgi:hypothetical protein
MGGKGSGRPKGCIPWHKGLTKETDSRVAACAEKRKGQDSWSKGLTKETDPRVRSMAEKMVNIKMGNIPWNKGLTKETHPSLAIIAAKGKEHTKEKDPMVARRAEARKGKLPWNAGLTKEIHPGLMAISIRQTGRTAKDDIAVARRAETRRGRTKENNPSIARQSEKLTGRTMKDYPYLVNMAEKRRGKYTGENSPNWQGGISFEPYPVGFNGILREYIRDRDDYICQGCGVNEEYCWRKLDIHHINYDKMNINENNLVAVCRECNTRANVNREFWQRFFNDKLISRCNGILIYG